MTDINWRPYQLQCKTAIKKNYDDGVTKQLIVAATGTGKRLQAVSLMHHFPRTLFIAHREELIMQAYNEIEKYYPMEVGIIKGPVFEHDKKIVVSSVQTLYNRLNRLDPETFQLIIIDEAHHYASKTYLASARHWKPKLLTGWTATPRRLDGLSLSNLFEKIVFEYSIQNGILDGYLCPIEAYQVKTSTDISNVRKVAGDFNQSQLSEAVDSVQRNDLIVKKYLQYAQGRQGIAYCVDMDHSYNLRDAFRRAGVKCETIVSDQERCPNRSELVSEFRNGEYDVLTNCEILTEGFDYSDVGCVMMCRPTQSETLYVQCIGRGTRLKSNQFKEKFPAGNCIVLDFVDNTGRLSLVNAYELEKGKPVSERLFLPAEHKEKLLEEERIKRERRMRIQTGADKRIDLLVLPTVHVWDSEKMLEPATEKQLAWLMRAGIYQPDMEYTKKQASELISNLPCQQWQVIYLASNGYDVSAGATIGQYQRVKFILDNRQKFAIKQQ